MDVLRLDLRARRVVAAQWAVAFGPPIVWALRFGLNYALMPLACSAGALPLLHALNASALLVLIALGWLAWRFRRGSRDAPADGVTDTVRRTRFMALFGVMSAALFAVVIAAEALATLMIDPCLTAGPLVPH